MKRAVVAILALLVVGTGVLIAGCGGGLPSDAVARVGKVVITQAEFDKRTADFEAQYAGQVPDKTSDPQGYKLFQQEVLDYMITYQIAKLEAPSFKVTVTDADVQKEIDNLVTQSFGGDKTKFDAALKAQNITLDQLKSSYAESMLLQKVYDAVTKNITTVSDARITDYYNAHKSDYYTAETRTARHILISPTVKRDSNGNPIPTSTTSTTASTSTTVGPSTTGGSSTSASSSTTTTAAPTQADWDAALALAQKVRADLVAGADWKTEAAKYSDDTGTKDNGGDLGTITKGEMVKEFEDAVFSLKLNEISQPVKTIYGYHIIQVTGITPAKQSTLAEVKADITSTLLNTDKGNAWQAWVAKTRAEVGVVIKPGLELTTTTSTTAGTSTSSGAATSGASTSSSAATGGTTTTGSASESATTAVAPATTTTTAPTTSTTVQP